MKTLASFLTVLIFLVSFSALAQPGSLDGSFGINGKVLKNMDFTGQSVAIQKDGKIVVCGASNGNFGLIRFNTNGSVDSGFGVNGTVTTSFGSDYVEPVGVAIQKDGKIIVAGSIRKWIGYMDIYGFALARYKTNGLLDHSFGDKGKVITANETVDYIRAATLALQADGKILVAGNNISEYFSQVILHRYNTDGANDADFHPDTGFSIYDLMNSIALQSDQKIIGTGFTYVNHTKFHFLLTRFKTDGSLDSAFANAGKNTTGLETGVAVAVLKNDKIAALTDSSSLKQFTRDGVADSLFGKNGKVSVPFKAKAIAAQSNKIIVIGMKNGNFAIARYKLSGKLDNSFGINGIAVANFGGNDEAAAVAIRKQDGKIVTTGSSDTYQLAVARFNGDSNTASVAGNTVITNAHDASKKSLSVNIYPNPFRSTLNIDFISTGKTRKKISVYDMRGSLLYTTSTVGSTRLNLRSLVYGSYLIKVTDENGKELYNGKVIKQ
ncbi:MAG TPA: T9SS type A sorting domain-containing protein [Parafilimonas sp.]|nr:T9SS type A sorting domain-containing protein [Parafilimonas sp.]